MSKSLRRVQAALLAAGLEAEILEMADCTRTAAQAAAAAGCKIDQIVKSIVLHGEAGDVICLFLTPGGRQIDLAAATTLAGQPLGRADPDLVRARTGFAIGGVAPIGHLSAPRTWMDPRLFDFERVWAAAGTPRHVFAIAPDRLASLAAAVCAPFAI